MPRFEVIPPSVKLATSPTVKMVTREFKPEHKLSYKTYCDLFLKEGLYSPIGQFRHLWKTAYISDCAFISYLSISRRPVAVAFIERGYDFGFPMPSTCEGFISCFVKPEYRAQGVASKLCKAIIEQGGFTEVMSQRRLAPAIQNIRDLKIHTIRD
jgi:GNAT superfamily N-acetyltransferase